MFLKSKFLFTVNSYNIGQQLQYQRKKYTTALSPGSSWGVRASDDKAKNKHRRVRILSDDKTVSRHNDEFLFPSKNNESLKRKFTKCNEQNISSDE